MHEQRGWLVYYGTRVETGFLARTAVYARRRGFMKATPALLCAVLAMRDGALLERIFHRVIDNGRMLRGFVGHLRSGALGRWSLGRRPKRLVQAWFDRRDDDQILRASVGNGPSLVDVIRLAHVDPRTLARTALFRYLMRRDYDSAALPPLVRQLVAFQRGEGRAIPDVPFQLLTGASLSPSDWRGIALRGGWQMIRMNLNTFARHGVFDDPELVRTLQHRLSDPSEIRRARQLPFQLMVARDQLSDEVPAAIGDAMDRAVDEALVNVPTLPGKVHIAVDVSDSMHSRLSARGKARCIDVAAMVAAAVLRRNPAATVIPFHDRVVPVQLDPDRPLRELSASIASLPSGGTNCSAPLAWLNARKDRGQLVLMISDNQSWVDAREEAGQLTPLMCEWRRFRANNPDARLVCLDLQPYHTVQAPPGDDVLHIGGFSDEVFRVLQEYQSGDLSLTGWRAAIEEIAL
ncbi:MAG: RNA-binding protein [Myxococcota bacterium]